MTIRKALAEDLAAVEKIAEAAYEIMWSASARNRRP